VSRLTRFLADEDFDNDIVRGVRRRMSEVDIVRVQDEQLSGAPDARVLEWAAHEGRIVLTHDISTMKLHAYARVEAGLQMPGVFVVNQSVPVGEAIEAIQLLAECSLNGEWEGQVRHLPFE
jgi:hypothetical protein